jgi:hypothetical protein
MRHFGKVHFGCFLLAESFSKHHWFMLRYFGTAKRGGRMHLLPLVLRKCQKIKSPMLTWAQRIAILLSAS